jgi:hypothetical protein
MTMSGANTVPPTPRIFPSAPCLDERTTNSVRKTQSEHVEWIVLAISMMVVIEITSALGRPVELISCRTALSDFLL